MITLFASEARTRNVLLSQIRLVAGRRIIFLFNKGHRRKARWITSRKTKRINRKSPRGKILKEGWRKLSLLKVMDLLGAVDIDWTRTNTNYASIKPTKTKLCHHTCATSNQKNEVRWLETNRWLSSVDRWSLARIKIFNNNKFNCTISSLDPLLNNSLKFQRVVKVHIPTNWITWRSTCLQTGIVNANN